VVFGKLLKKTKKALTKSPLGGISGVLFKDLNVTPSLIKKKPVSAVKRSAVLGTAAAAALNPVGVASLAAKAIPKSFTGKASAALVGITGARILQKSPKARKVVSKTPEKFIKTGVKGGDIIAKTIETGDPGISPGKAVLAGGLAAGAVVGGAAIIRTVKGVKEKALTPGTFAVPPTPLPQKSSIESPPGAANLPVVKTPVATTPKLLPNIQIDIDIDNRRSTKKFINQQVLIN